MGCRGTAWLAMVFTMGCREGLCFGTWGIFSISFTHLDLCRAAPPIYYHSSLLTFVDVVQVLPPTINYIFTEVRPSSLALASRGSVLELASLPLPAPHSSNACRPLYQNLATQTQYEGMGLQSPQMILAMHFFVENRKPICLNHYITMDFVVKHM